MQQARIGFLSDEGLQTVERVVSPAVEYLGPHPRAAVDLARRHGLTQLWLVPGSRHYAAALAAWVEWQPDAGDGWTINPGKRATIITAFRGDDYLQILLPGCDKEFAKWPLNQVTEPREFARVVQTLNETLGVRVSIPSRTGKDLIKQTTPRAFLKDAGDDLKIFRKKNELDFVYKREALTDAERAAAFVHKVDKRAQYLACCSIPLGAGEPERVAEYSPRLPGLWRVRFTEPLDSLPLFRVMPGFVDQNFQRSEFVYSPLLAWLAKEGARFEVVEGWVWRESHKPLDNFYRTIKAGLTALESQSETSSVIALSCLKSVYTQSIGILARSSGSFDSNLFRPDWRNIIISESKARLLANIKSAYTSAGVLPAAIRVDALFYFSDERNYLRALPDVFTKPGSAYRFKYTVPAVAALGLWDDAGANVGDIDEALKGVSRGA